MKNQQHEAARELYFNTSLSKTEIAERLSVTRRTIYQWSIDGNWEKLRQSARHMPAILAEKCYYLIGHLTDQLLSADSSDIAISKQDVDMLHKLTIIVNKLKRGTTVADNMETFTYFLERIQRRDPELAEKVAPHVTDYIAARRGKDECSFLLDGFDETGHLPYPEKEIEEHHLDELEAEALKTHTHTHTETSHAEASREALKTLTHTHTAPEPLQSKPVQQQATSKPNSKPQQPRQHEAHTSGTYPIAPYHSRTFIYDKHPGSSSLIKSW